ncbi:MAG: GNAT family N-acetyltransferase [Burkholderiaceae bacterium]|nr:MAG: GNAT family N-acetyltransferase [Burkholderiaceae bacterium]
MSHTTFTLKTGTWDTLKAHAQAIRLAVFVEEQKVPLDMEWDEWDARSLHAVAFMGNQAVATGRLLPDGHIGRMAVLKEWRQQKIGSAILRLLMLEAHARGQHHLILHAQTSAAAFYEHFGFTRSGEEFEEAGIAHVRMEKTTR